MIDHTQEPLTAKKTSKSFSRIPITAFEKFIETHPHLAFRIIKGYEPKNIFLATKINEMLSLNVEERLLSTLKQINTLLKSEAIHLTHQELGNIIGATRETVTRQLKKLEQQGRVKVQRSYFGFLIEL
ncbi:Crp/Fnr family transcriptional regulator [Anaerobacillus sp. HL2]|nr:Crp/Fnr family transcriptional regulator [Anaerobacillus sp. HL2]